MNSNICCDQIQWLKYFVDINRVIERFDYIDQIQKKNYLYVFLLLFGNTKITQLQQREWTDLNAR